MADPAGIEASQERVHREVLQQTREHALRNALLIYEPTLAVGTLAFREVLTRLEEVIAKELARLDAPEGA